MGILEEFVDASDAVADLKRVHFLMLLEEQRKGFIYFLVLLHFVSELVLKMNILIVVLLFMKSFVELDGDLIGGVIFG